MITIPIDFAKIAALGDYARYSDDSIFMGSEIFQRGSEHKKLSSGWIGEVLGQHYGLQIYDVTPSDGRGTNSIYEVFGKEWSVLFKPRMYNLSWTVPGEEDVSFQTRFADVSGVIWRYRDVVLVGSYEAYQTDMAFFMLVSDRARQTAMRRALLIKKKPHNLDHLFAPV